MFRNAEEQAALALLLAVCDPQSDVARAYTAESEAVGMREAIRDRLGEDAHYEVDPAYREAFRINEEATFRFITAPAKTIPELALKLAAIVLDHHVGEPFYIHRPTEEDGFVRIIAEIRAVAAAGRLR